MCVPKPLRPLMGRSPPSCGACSVTHLSSTPPVTSTSQPTMCLRSRASRGSPVESWQVGSSSLDVNTHIHVQYITHTKRCVLCLLLSEHVTELLVIYWWCRSLKGKKAFVKLLCCAEVVSKQEMDLCFAFLSHFLSERETGICMSGRKTYSCLVYIFYKQKMRNMHYITVQRTSI